MIRTTMKKYRWAFAIENQIVDEDYFTEKLFDALEVGVIPIYKGSTNYKEMFKDSLMLMNAVIWWDDYPNIQALAKHIQSIDRDETLYNEMLAWKTKPLPRGFINLLSKSIGNTNCRVCERYWDIKQGVVEKIPGTHYWRPKHKHIHNQL